MIDELLRIYEESRLNEGNPESFFNPTLIFEEGWLLRAVMRHWRLAPTPSRLPFLPLPAHVRLYSEGQLFTPFGERYRGDKLAEKHTHVDGIAGDFRIQATKSGIEVDSLCRYLAVFEAKLYSPIAPGTVNAPGYDQVSRTVACLINSLLRANCPHPPTAHVVILHPAANRNIRSERYSAAYLEQQIALRADEYNLALNSPFGQGWRDSLRSVRLSFVTWETVLDEICDERLSEFYRLCLRFNQPR